MPTLSRSWSMFVGISAAAAAAEFAFGIAPKLPAVGWRDLTLFLSGCVIVVGVSLA